MNTTVLLTLLCILLSAYFSGMEIAFVSSNKLLLEMDKNSHSITSKIICYFHEHSNDYISTILVGNNIVMVIYGILMASLIGGELLGNIIESQALLLLIQTVISTIIIIITGEFVPKTLFKINPNGALKAFAIPTFLFYICLYPLSKFTTFLSNFFLKLFRVKINKEDSERAFSKTELDYLIQRSLENAGDDNKENNDVKIFQNALDFSGTKVRDCFVPRTEIDGIELNSDVEKLKSLFIESGHSKIIVYKDNVDNIVGYIHSSELFKNANEWQKHICKMAIVPETLPAQKMMRLFMQQKKSLAVVVDEFGGTSGIVSLEDLVEEIFGDIEDEHDTTSYEAKKISNNEYLLSGRLEVEKINNMFNLDLKESDDYQTLGGLILHIHQSFPKLNETIRQGKFQYKIVKRSNTKIDLVRVTVIDN